MRAVNFAVAALAAMAIVNTSQAATMVSDSADGRILADGTVASTTDASVATVKSPWNPPAQDAQIELVFQLPSLGNVTDPFNSASFSFVGDHSGDQWAAGQLDLNGLTSVRSGPALLGTDYQAAGTSIQSGIMNYSNGAGTYTTDTVGSGTLLNWLNTQYGGGTNAGKYVFLTLSTGNGNEYHFYSANTNESGGTNIPTITFTAVPEPASIGLLAMTAVGLLARRRKV